MSPKKSLQMSDIKPIKSTRKSKALQKFGDIVIDDSHVKFQDMDGETVYITKLEILASDDYGSGFKVWFKHSPKDQLTLTAGVFGQYPVAQLEKLYQLTHNARTISPDTPVQATIRKAGQTYRFE